MSPFDNYRRGIGVLLPMRSAFAVIVLLTLLPLFLTLRIHGGFAEVDLWWLIALMLLVRGLGLTGLRERISPLGGYLEAGPLLLQGKEHFRVSVELPFESQGETSASQEE